MAEFSLINKVGVITGGASGIGFAIAEEFLKKGAKKIILLDITDKGYDSENELNSKYGSQKAVFLKCNVTKDLDKISEKIYKEYKKVDILVNCAGIVNENSIRKTMDVNAIALIEWSMKFYDHMSIGKDGTIINISSTYGIRTDQFAPFYKASKFAVLGFSKTLGHVGNYEKSGVRVITICPGFTKTNLGTGPENSMNKDEAFQEFLNSKVWQEAEVVGKAAVEVYETARSGTAWVVEAGKCTEIN